MRSSRLLTHANPGEMTPAEFRFALEFAAGPDIGAVRNRTITALQSDCFIIEWLFADAASPLDRFLLLRVPSVERTSQEIGPRGETIDAVKRWCNVDVAAPAAHMWAPNKIAAPAAWGENEKKGADIVVAQPDTGVIPTHVGLIGMLDMTRARSMFWNLANLRWIR